MADKRSGDPALGQRIARLRARKGLTQGQLADLMGVSQRTVSNWETGARDVGRLRIGLLARTLGTTPDALNGARETRPVRQIREELADYLDRVPLEAHVYPLDAAAAMGAGMEPLDTIPLPIDIRPTDKPIYGLLVSGDSMLPDLPPNSYIFVDPDGPRLSGKIVVAIVDGTVMVKWYKPRNGRHFLVSNADTIEVEPSDIRGVVVWSSRRH